MKISKSQLELIADLIDIDADNIRTSYSGRGMYGDQCVGFIVDSLGVAVLLGVAMAQAMTDLDDEYPDFEEAYHFASKAQFDQMGRSYILYFPGVTLA